MGYMTTLEIGVFCYNQAAFVADCLKSLKVAHSHALERDSVRFYVCDDGSTDDSASAILEFFKANPSMAGSATMETTRERMGFERQLGRWLRASDAEWCVVVAADDLLLPRSVEMWQQTVEELPSAEVLFGDLIPFDAGFSQRPSETRAKARKQWLQNQFGQPRPLGDTLLTVGNFVPGGGTLIRRCSVPELFLDTDTLLRNAEDFWLWLVMRECLFAYTGVPTLLYRRHDGSKSAANNRALGDSFAGILKRSIGLELSKGQRSLLLGQAALSSKSLKFGRLTNSAAALIGIARILYYRASKHMVGTLLLIRSKQGKQVPLESR